MSQRFVGGPVVIERTSATINHNPPRLAAVGALAPGRPDGTRRSDGRAVDLTMQ
jgi:hypothetical protein